MPRPKRTKIVSAHAKAQTQAAAAKSQSHATAPTLRSTRTSTGIADSPVNRKATTRVSRQDGVEISMSGGLGLGDVKGAHKIPNQDITRLQRASGVTGESRRLTRLRNPLEELSPARSVNQRIGNSSSRKRSTVASKTTLKDANNVPEPLDDGFEEYLLSSSPHLPTTVVSRPQSAAKVQGTPSFLSIANFKKRPRQPSILRTVRQKLASDAGNGRGSDMDTTFDMGRSSPYHSSVLGASASRKRKASTLEPEDIEPNPAEQRDERLDSWLSAQGVQTEATGSRRELRAAVHDDEQLESVDNSPDLLRRQQAIKTTTPTIKKALPARGRGRRMPPKHAPPQTAVPSSPPISDNSPESTPSSHNNGSDTARKANQPGKKTDGRATKRQKTSKAAKPNITTASLQSLLPRRRVPAVTAPKQGDFDLPSSSEATEDGDEEETSDMIVVDYSKKQSKKTVVSSETIDEDEDDEDDEDFAETRPKRTNARSTAKKGKNTASKTYSRRTQQQSSESVPALDSNVTLSDGEGDSTDKPNGKTGKKAVKTSKAQELREAEKRFKEVDNWDLSFESVDVGGGSSSPWR